MQEPALSFEGATLSPQKEMVRMFYKDMWDHADKSLIPKIFPPSCHAGPISRVLPYATRFGKRAFSLSRKISANLSKPAFDG
jgi:L-serine deaminase